MDPHSSPLSLCYLIIRFFLPITLPSGVPSEVKFFFSSVLIYSINKQFISKRDNASQLLRNAATESAGERCPSDDGTAMIDKMLAIIAKAPGVFVERFYR